MAPIGTALSSRLTNNMFAAKDLFFDSNTGGYRISRSVRLRSAASAYFNRTPASTTNRRTMTFSFWMKRGLLTYSANYLELFTAYPGTSAIDQISFSPSSDSLRVWFNGSSSADLITTQVFRDPSAWYHVVVANPPLALLLVEAITNVVASFAPAVTSA